MICRELISPRSIAIVGASDNVSKPGGKVLRNLLDHHFTGPIYGVNPKKLETPGITHVKDIAQIPEVDLAILAIPATDCLQAVNALIAVKAKAFVVFSAGFAEIGEEGRELEKALNQAVDEVNGTLIGPNCIGVIQKHYKGVFTTPIPEYHADGCELISSSGATAVFIMEAAMKNGLRFSNVYSIGNGSQTGVEEILEYMDQNYVSGESPKVKLLYLEQIRNPFKFIKHATSLVHKGCKIAAIKSGYSEAGSRAATSHTGALATSDAVIRALFKKCGIVYCSGREELISVAGIFQMNALTGENIAIITHAGGSAVMLTDALTSNGLKVPPVSKDKTQSLAQKLNPGSSVENPFDFLATGTAEQLGEIIDFCEMDPELDAMIVVFGSPGLINVKRVYEVLLTKMEQCTKPIYPVLPSVVNAADEIKFFLEKGKVNFPDEVVLGRALAQVFATPAHTHERIRLPEIDFVTVRSIINAAPKGFMEASVVSDLMEAVGIAIARQRICAHSGSLELATESVGFPVVMKVIGPVHKTEVNGVRLPIHSLAEARVAFEDLMQIKGAKSVLIQEMLAGEELYCGAIKQGDFGHLVLCGMGGIFLELLHDTAAALAPIAELEARVMIRSLKGYPLIKGYRNRPGLDEDKFVDIVTRLAALVHMAPEISEIDLNPIIASGETMCAVDVRIKIA